MCSIVMIPRLQEQACLNAVALARWLGVALTAVMLLAVGLSPTLADEDPYRITHDAIMTKGNVNYSAERVVELYQGGRRTRAVRQRVYRKRGDKQHIETLEPPSEAGQLVVSNGQWLWEYSPQKREVIQRQLQPSSMLTSNRQRAAQLIREVLVLQYIGRATVASRPAHELAIRDESRRLLRKCWIDTGTHVELKLEKYGGNGALYMRIEITSIDYGPSFVAGMFSFATPAGVVLRRAPPPAKRMALATAEQLAGFRAIVPAYLPSSYIFESNSVAVTTYKKMRTLWLTFTNGLDSFSLFETRWQHTDKSAQQQKSATQWYDDGICFTLVGDLTAGEIEKLMRSLRQ